MLYRHGSNFTSQEGEFTLLGYAANRIRNARERTQYDRITLQSGFCVHETGQDAIKSRIDQIANALSQDGVDSGFIHDGGGRSFLFLPNSTAIGGVKVIQPVSIQATNQADYATGLQGTFSVQGDYRKNSDDSLLDYAESVTVTGNGGRNWTEIVTDKGPVLFVPTAEYTPGRITQQGHAVGFNAWPIPNARLLQDSEDVKCINPAEAVTRHAPKRNGDGFNEFRVEWNYQYRTRGNVSALPTIK